MNEKQLEALFKWLDGLAYIGAPEDGGEYLIMDELREFLPAAIKRIMEQDNE